MKTRFDKREEPIWEEDLIMCPSQCYCYFEAEGKIFCIYLRWRYCDPWTADLVQFESVVDWGNSLWRDLDIEYYSHDKYKKLQEECVSLIKEKYAEIQWLVEIN